MAFKLIQFAFATFLEYEVHKRFLGPRKVEEPEEQPLPFLDRSLRLSNCF